MDFDPGERIRGILETIDRFVADQIQPLEPDFLVRPFSELLLRLDERRDQVRELGLWAPGHPAELGGMGLDLVDLGLISETVGRSPLGHYVFGMHAPDAGNVEVLHRHGSDEQKARWLVPLVAGKIRSCFSMTEPELPGSNPVMLATTAVVDGDDYMISGHKWYTTAADGAAFAIVMAVTDTEADPHRRASMILVPTDTPGFELVRNIPVMGHAGDDYFSHSEIVYRDCRVPRANLIGEPGRGFAIAQERLGPGRIHHCMRWLGICRRAFEMMCDRAQSRTIAPGQKLADKEIVQSWIAESHAEIEAARALTLQTAWKIDRYGWRAARQDISAIKFLVANTLQRVVDRALQVHGALGMTDDTLLAFYYREERAARIYDGPDEVHKISLARRILKDRRG